MGGNMEEVSETGDGSRERRRVFERAFGDLDRKIGEVVAIASRASEDANRMAPVEQRARHRRADKTGRSGDEAQARCEGHCRALSSRLGGGTVKFRRCLAKTALLARVLAHEA
jgi:hypothetical protein